MWLTVGVLALDGGRTRRSAPTVEQANAVTTKTWCGSWHDRAQRVVDRGRVGVGWRADAEVRPYSRTGKRGDDKDMVRKLARPSTECG